MRLTTSTGILAVKHKVFRALLLLSALLLLPSALMAQGKNAYALWLESENTLEFFCSSDIYQVGGKRSGAVITKLWSGDDVLNTPQDAAPGWADIKHKIHTIRIDQTFAEARPKSIAYWFDNSEIRSESAKTLTSIKGLQYLNTSEVTSMSNAFYRCEKLVNIDLSNFNTAKVTDMSNMFYGCSSLFQPNLSSFVTSRVQNFSCMFYNCFDAIQIDVSGFDTRSATDLSYMFYGCASLPSVDVSGFNTSNVTTLSNMFYGCTNIKTVDVSSFDVSKVSSTAYMFASCVNLATIRAAEDANWTSISDISNMFLGCSSLVAISTDGTSCTYASNKNMPYVCSNGEGYFTSANGYIIQFVGYTLGETTQQLVALDAGTVKLQKNTFTHPEKVFGSWNTEKNGSGTSYDDEDVIEVSSNMILYSQWGKDISKSEVLVNPLSFTYKGEECKPSVFVEDNYTSLTADKDFTVTYSNNVNAGEATVKIRGIGNYAGTIIEKFTVKPANIGVATISPQRQILSYNGEEQYPDYSLRFDNAKLEEGTDYTVSGLKGNSATGDYDVTFTGKGNFTGTTTVTYTITAQKAYAVWTEDNSTLTFIMAETAPVAGGNYNGYSITNVWSGDEVLNSPQNGVPAWNSVVSGKVVTIAFDATFAEASPKSIAYWFANEGTLKNINKIANLNTSATTSMSHAFSNCSGINTVIDVTKFNTERVTNMSGMFQGCSNVKKIDVSGFITEAVTDMSSMFAGCSKVTKLATDNFDTKNVVAMDGMFKDCAALTEAVVGGFYTEKVTNMEDMFSGCSLLRALDLSGFSTGSVTNMESMFKGCSSLAAVTFGNNFKTDNVTTTKSMFDGCDKLTTLDLSRFNTAKVTDMANMFNLCQSLVNLNISSFNTASVKDMSNMFAGCAVLNKIDVSKFETGSLLNADGMFSGCESIAELNLSSFDLANVTSINKMFAGCSALTTIRTAEDANWSSVASHTNVFEGCTSLVGIGIDGTHCNYQDGVDAPFVCADGNGYFTPGNIYVITLHKNIDGDNEVKYQVVKIPVSNPVTLVANTFETQNYNFGGWNTYANGDGTFYKDGGEIRVTSDVDLYAQWGKDIATCKVYSSIAPNYYTYTGSKLYPYEHGGSVIVKDGSKILTQNVDYTVKYPENIINVGTYEVEIVGKGTYAGSFVMEYEIEPYDIDDVTIEPDYAIYIYNGSEQRPDYAITDNNGNALKEGIDYNAVIDMESVEAGEYLVEFEGIGNYTGSNFAQFAIKNAFALWTETNNTLTFVLSDNSFMEGSSHVDGHRLTSAWHGDDITKSPVDGKPAWKGILDKVTTVKFDGSFADVKPTSIAYWFAGAENLKNIINPENLVTDNVTSMSHTFYGCKSLENIDLSKFVTANVTNMSHMFDGCAALTELNVKSFSVRKVTSMDGMFANCTSLAKITANNSDDWTSTNPSITGMFDNDNALVGVGSDNTFCEYADGENYPYVCKDGKGYFTGDNIYIITFDNNFNGGQRFQSVLATNIAPVKLDANEFVRPGYLFYMWTTEADGSGSLYDDESSIRISENVTLYAAWKKDIAACSPAFDPATPTYTGEAITSELTLTDGNYVLVENTDYILEGFTNNKDAGNASVTVKGRGDYAGTAVFGGLTILPRNLQEIDVTSSSALFEYNKQVQVPTFTLKFGEKVLVAGTDFTVSDTDANIDAKKYTVTFTGKDNYTGTNTAEYEITPCDIATVATLATIDDCEYNGSAIAPELSIADGDNTLVADKDYTAEFTNNVNAGDANITITGKGNYKGTLESKFHINPLNLSKVAVLPATAELPYNRTAQNPDYVLSVNGYNLVIDQDYTMSGDLAKTDVADDYTVTFTAVSTGNFTGTATAKYSIVKCDFTEHARIVFDGDKSNFTYTGSLITPNVTVVDDNNNILVEGSDYTLDNTGNTEIGSYDITATGTGNYTGTVKGNYRIVEKSIEDTRVEFAEESFTYNGSEIKPEVSVFDGEVELVAGTDYNVEYNNNINAGSEAEVIINGAGKYDISRKVVKFTINPRDISNATAVADAAVAYNGEAQVAQFTITDGSATLVLDNDYTVGNYSNNIDAAEDYEVTFAGKGNYTGTISGKYTIEPRSIAGATVSSDDQEVVFNGGEQSIRVAVADGDKTLEEGKDFSVAYTDNVNVGTATATINGTGNYKGSATTTLSFAIKPLDFANVTIEPKDGKWSTPYTGNGTIPECTLIDKFGNALELDRDYTVSNYSNNIAVGSDYEVTFSGTGNYTGSVTANYDIRERSIADAEIIFVDGVKEFTYTGSEIKPVEKVMDLDNELEAGVDYSISYSGNKEPGTATITITGRGKYTGGNKIENFTIVPIKMSDVTVSLSAAEFPYNKRAQKPTYTLTDKRGEILVAGTDFTVEGDENNVNVGEYTVTFNAVEGGHYDGSTTAVYAITPQQIDINLIAVQLGATEFVYSGKAVEPAVTVTYENETLVADTDYEVSYSDNGNVDAGTVVVTIKGLGNYAGFSVEGGSFVIKPYNMADVTITADQTSFTYGGKDYSPEYTLVDGNGNTLEADVDYDMTGNTNNVNAGTYTVTFTGKLNYAGTQDAQYVIERYDIGRETCVVEFKDGISEFEYTGSDITPEFDLTINGYKLNPATDYTVSGATSKTNAGTYEIIAEGTGNFTGTKNASYRINPRNIDGTAAIIVDGGNKFIETGSAITPAISVSDGTGFLASTDYEVEYSNNVNPGTATITVKGVGNYDGFNKTEDFTILPKKPVIEFNVEEGAELVYGNSLVGRDIKATVDEIYNGSVSYDKSGLLASGSVTITANYTPNDDNSIASEGSVAINIAKRVVEVSGVEVATIKDYDGTTAAVVTKQPTEISNVINNDQVTVTATAEYAAAKPGNQVIYISYNLSGADADNYIARKTSIEGEIKKLEIKADVVWNVDNTSAIDYFSSSEQSDKPHFCAGDRIEISTNASGLPNSYKLTFSDPQFGEFGGKYPADGKLSFAIPEGVSYGKITMSLVLENVEAESQSDPYTMEFYLDGAADGSANSIVKQKWDDVVYASNAKDEFVSYQWYRDGKPLPGSTGQYYQEVGGLQTATYAVKIGKADGGYVFTCPFKATAKISKSVAVAGVKVYPNPASANQQFTIEIVDAENIDGNTTIMLYNHNGVLVKRIDNASTINHATLPAAGQYTGIAVVDGKKLTFRVIVY